MDDFFNTLIQLATYIGIHPNCVQQKVPKLISFRRSETLFPELSFETPSRASKQIRNHQRRQCQRRSFLEHAGLLFPQVKDSRRVREGVTLS